MHRLTIVVALTAGVVGVAHAQPYTIETFDDIEALEARTAFSLYPVDPAEPAASPQYAAGEDAAVGDGALTVTLPAKARITFAVDPELVWDNEEWDACNAIRFWLKGDGSDGYGCVAFGPRYPYLYEVWFPLKDTNWHQVTYRLDELVSMSDVGPMGSPGMAPPSGIATIVLGTRWYLIWNNEPKPEYSFSIDNIELIVDASVPEPPSAPRQLADVLRMMRDKQPVRIYCMGDSLTAGPGLADKYNEQYAAVLQGLLRERLGYDEITVESRAVGGSKLVDACVWAERDFAGPPPDLATICYGYNNKSAGHTKDFFKRSLADYIARVCKLTGGATAIVPITTRPGGQWRFVMLDDYAEGVREVCAAQGLECLDLAAQTKSLGRMTWQTAYLRDRAHPTADAHRWLAERMAEWFVTRVEEL